jgi:hypothetical protein
MANESAAVVAPVNKPVVLEAHEADKAARAAAREKKKRTLIRCLDPEQAAQYESRKPLYEWAIKCSYMKPQEKGGLRETTEEAKVVAKTETDAWAMFCDKQGLMIGRKACLEVTITRLEKRTISDDE